ncbi:MAG TPA: HEAT repeat domain-containing protein [Candidatus Binatia bacterium]|nr:HEAT repeat domain-containing protein [Candidatus Binatia bacterium]
MTLYCPECWQELPRERPECLPSIEELFSGREIEHIAKIIQALTHPKSEVRRRAIHLAGERQLKRVAGALKSLYRETKDPFQAAEIVTTLGKIGGELAFLIITEALHHPAFIVRSEAVKALASFKDESVPSFLQQALKDPSASVRELAAVALEDRPMA